MGYTATWMSTSKPAGPDEWSPAEEDLWLGSSTARDLSESQKKEVAFRQKYLCAGCDCLLPPSYQVDHIRPLALGGTNGLSNLQALCPKCHTSKTRQQRHQILASKSAQRLANRSDDANNGKSVAPVARSRRRSGSKKLLDASSEVTSSGKDADTAIVQERATVLGLDSLDLSSLKLLRGMNQQQLAAVVCIDGPMRVAAGPGTGKTRVLTARIAHLIVEAKVEPRRVLGVTFTNKAARELRTRITSLIGPDRADSITMGTFHSLCLAMLRVDIERLPPELGYRRGFTVYDEHAALKLIKKLKERVEGGKTAQVRTRKQKKDEELSAGTVQAVISAAKNDGYDAHSFRTEPPLRYESFGAEQLGIITSVFELYQQTLRSENIIDYDDMLLLTRTLLRTSERIRQKYSSHWRHITVDEFQDTNSIQYDLLSLLGQDHKNVFVVGDADQAIYGWRGADIRNQDRLDSDFVIRTIPPVPAAPLPATAYENVTALKKAISMLPLPRLLPDGGGRRLTLELNYRSRQGILDMAQRLLAPSYAADPGMQLRLVTPDTYGSGSGTVPSAATVVQVTALEDSEHEAEWVVDEILHARTSALPDKAQETSSVAILYRTNAQSMAFERRLVREGVPYVLAAQRSFYARKEIRDVIAYLRLLRSNDTISLERIINVPPRKIGAATLATLHKASDVCGVNLWEAVELYAVAPENVTQKDDERLPKLGKAARTAIRNFHSLIVRFRDFVQREIEEDQTSDVDTSFNRNGNDDQHNADEVQLKMVSSEVWRRAAFQNPSMRDPEGLPAQITQAAEEEEEIDGTYAAAKRLADSGTGSLAALLRLLLLESGYEEMVKREAEGEESARWRNLGDLANLANQRRVSEIDDFLDQIALVSDVDSLDGQGATSQLRNAVQLSTIHSAKGLEFDTVFVTGVEEGLLPHYFSSNTLDEIEEERRLLYVAMTRARERLILTHSQARARWGKAMPVERSRFLEQLPKELEVAPTMWSPKGIQRQRKSAH